MSLKILSQLAVTAFLLGLTASPGNAATGGGIDTPAGVETLPLSVQGIEGMGLVYTGSNTPPNTIMLGNVGIGSSSPQSKLDVNGPVKVGSASSGSSCSIEGSVAYDTALHVLVYCNGNAWVPSSGGALTRTTELFTSACSTTTSISLGKHQFCALTSHQQSSGKSAADVQCYLRVSGDVWTMYAHTAGQCVTCGGTCFDLQ